MKQLLKFEKHFGLIIFLSSLLLYLNTIFNFYNLDDNLVTINHRNTSKGLSAISNIINEYYYEDDMGYKYDYRPITHLIFALEHQFLGESPHISHAVNVLIYAVVCLLLFSFLKNLLPQNLKLLAWIATMLFVFHPIHTEVVASIKNRDELLAVFFGLLGGVLILNASEKKQYWKNLPAGLFFFLSLLSKVTFFPFLILFPVGLILFKRVGFKEIILSTIPLGIAGYLSLKLIFDSNKSYIVYFSVLSVLLLFILFNFNDLLKRSIKILKNLKVSFVEILRRKIIKVSDEIEEYNPIINLKFYTSTIHFSFIFFILLLFTVNMFLELFNDEIFALLIVVFFISAPNKKSLFASLLLIWFFSVGYLFSLSTFQNEWLGVLIGLSVIALIKLNIKKYVLFSLFFGFLLLGFSIFSKSSEDILSSIILCLVITTLYISILLKKTYLTKVTFLIVILIVSLNLFKNDFLQIFFILLAIISLFIKNWGFKKILNWFYIAIIFLFFSKTIGGLIFEIKLPLASEEIIEISNLTFNEEKDDPAIDFKRPLNFIESPVHSQSPTEEKIATGALIFSKYLKKVILPYPMGFYYGYAYITPQKIEKIENYFHLFLLLIFVILTIYIFLKKYYLIGFGLLIYFSTIFQVLGVFYPIPGSIGDRFLFLPSLGFCLILGWVLNKLINKNALSKFGLLVFTGIIISYSFITVQRNFQWKDRITLFETDIDYLNQSAQAQALLGYAYMQKANEDDFFSNQEYLELAKKAKMQFEKAINIYPDFVNWWYDKGRIESEIGKIDESLNSLKKAISLDKGFLPDPYFDIANIYFYKGEFQEAIYFYNEAIKWGYNEPVVYNSIAVAYIELGNIYAAESTLLEGLKIYPKNFDINSNLGKVYLELNDLEQALKFLEAAYNINPTEELKILLENIKN